MFLKDGINQIEGNAMEKKTYSFKDLMVTPVEAGEDEHIKYRRMKYRKTDTTSESVEHDLEEKISIQTRLKKSRTMKKNKSRLALARKKAMKKTAQMATINKRSRKSARKAMFMKLSKGKKPSELPMAKRQEIEDRLNKSQFQQRIGVTAKRLRPHMRDLDKQRKTSTKG